MNSRFLVNLHCDTSDCTAITFPTMPLQLGHSENGSFVDRFCPNLDTVFDAVVVNNFDNAACLRHVDLGLFNLVGGGKQECTSSAATVPVTHFTSVSVHSSRSRCIK